MLVSSRSSIPNVVPALRPLHPGWVEWPVPDTHPFHQIAGAELWYHGSQQILVCSSVEGIAGEGGATRPEYHLSVSRKVWGRAEAFRCDMDSAQWAIKQFGFDGSEEDNHVPHGKVRNFFRPIAWNVIGQPCPCKKTEPEVREDQGDYVWRDAPG